MGYPHGKAPIKIGEVPTPETMPVFQGTEPVDMQTIIGARYHTSGILPSGGVQVQGTSSMAYKVTRGAVVLKAASGLALEYPVEEQTVNTAPAPSTGSRQDRIVMDANGNITVVNGAAPAGGITLGLFTVPAGGTSTAAATQSMDRNFAIPAGASLGRLAHWVDPGGVASSKSSVTRGAQRFYLPSDRAVEITFTGTVRASDDKTPGVMFFDVQIDSNEPHRVWVDYGSQWASGAGYWSETLREGAHTVKIISGHVSGGLYKTSTGRSGTEVNVYDRGVSR